MNKKGSIRLKIIFAVGAIFVLCGLCGFVSLYQRCKNYVLAEGEILRVETQRKYSGRKFRRETNIQFVYQTERYGQLATSKKCNFPFWRTGDKISVLYNPVSPREISLPLEEKILWGFLLLLGAFIDGCIYWEWKRKAI